MKLKKREFTQEELNLYVIHDDEKFFLKHNGSNDSFDVEEGIEGAQIFDHLEVREVIDLNEDRKFDFTRVGDLIDTEKYELHEEE